MYLSHSPLRCLVVDDERSSRLMLRTILGNWGIQCVEACDGVEALQVMEQRYPDLVITDIEMPRCDGFCLLRKIRGSSKVEIKNLPVIMMSTLDSDQLASQLDQHSPLTFFSKPVDLMRLRRVIEYCDCHPSHSRFPGC